jgi:hypothetical protein
VSHEAWVRELAAIWATELGLDRVGIDDDFVDLGGDSYNAIQIAAEATERGIPVSPSDVYAFGTVRAMAASLPAAAPAAPEDDRP